MNADGVGRKARAERRRAETARKTAAIANAVDDLLVRYELGSSIQLSANAYQKRLEKLQSELMDLHPASREYRHARLLLNRRLQSILPVDGPLKPLPPLYPIVRSHNFRSPEWLKKVREIWRWEDVFKKRLREEPGRGAYAPDILLGLFLYSAATRSAICDEDILHELALYVQSEEHPLISYRQYLGIRMQLPVSSGACNDLVDSQGIMDLQVGLDAVSLGLLLRFLKKRPTEVLPIKNDFVAFLKASLDIRFPAPSNINTPQDFCYAALWRAENSIEGSWSAAFGEALLGRTRMLCPDATSEAALQTKNFRPRRLSALGLLSAYSEEQKKKDKVITSARSVTELERLFREILSVKGETRKETTHSLLKRLEPYRHAHWTPPGDILFEWLYSLLREHSLKPSTINRYFTAVGRLWLTVFEELDPALLESHELASAYHDIIDLVKKDRERSYARKRLRQLHRFAHRRYGAADILDDMFDGDGDLTLVSARIIPFAAVPAILQATRSLGANAEDGDQYALMFLLAYRCGMRVGEIKKLRSKDIESSAEGWAFIRANRYANNKTSAALRKIPLRLLLRGEERNFLDQYLTKRRHIDKDGRLPLFTPPGLETPYDSEEVSRSIGDAMNAVLRSKGWKFHHLRHTAFSLLQCIVEDEFSLAQELGGWTLPEMRNIRSGLIGNSEDRRSGYWAVALLAGHANPKTTMETYMHLMRPIVRSKIARTPIDLSDVEIAAAAGVSLRTARKIESAQALTNSLLKPAKRFLAPPPKLLEPFDEDVEAAPTLQPSIKEDVVTCERVLQTFEETLSIRTSAIRWRVDESVADGWLQNANIIANMTTREGKPRHVSNERINRANRSGRRVVLLPSKPRRQAELKEAHEIVDAMIKRYGEHPEDISWWASYALSNSNLSHPGVSFTAPRDLHRFLIIADNALSRKRWAVYVKSPGLQCSRDWKNAANGLGALELFEYNQKTKSQYIEGHARLILSPLAFTAGPRGPKQINWRKNSAKSFRYSFHLLGILAGIQSP